MASGEVLKRFQSYYSLLGELVSEFGRVHAKIGRYLGTIANIMERMPDLLDDKNYGKICGCGCAAIISERLTAAQTRMLEAIMQELSSTIHELEQIRLRISKVYRNACGMIQQDRRLTMTSQRFCKGPIPSIKVCLDGIEQIVSMHESEADLLQIMASEVNILNCDHEKVSKIATQVRTGHFFIDRQACEDLLYAVEATREPRSV